ncbi:MAG: ATP-dependent RecD-like DNA helicase [Clostridia bacterium]|nr:ATP-dependent RecD-like DNA helicase [Clostridia bacterium]
MEDVLLTLEGSVEEIIYQNQDNDYCVLAVITSDGQQETAVGTMGFVCEGEDVILYGKWVEHAEYGRQFSFRDYERSLPTGGREMLRYLSSRAVKGVGPVTAKRIVERFGDSAFDVIENHPEWLTDISGITEKKAVEIHRSFAEQTGIRSLMMLCREYLSTGAVSRIYKKFGVNAVEIVKKNPYALCGEVYGVAFAAVDRLAASLSFASDAEERVCGGILYVLDYNATVNGHTCLPRETLIAAAGEHLSVSAETVERALSLSLERGDVLPFSLRGKNMVAAKRYAEAETYIAEKMKQLDKSCVLYGTGDISLFISKIEKENGMVYASAQRHAISAALENGVMVLTGGPGTGKTTVVKALLRIFQSVGQSVLLLAPTGRAANRLSEATLSEAKTIHRALEMERADDLFPVFRKNDADPLEAKVIIVDEMSMVDVVLMAALLKAVRRGSRLVLIGDADQLLSVGAGRVLWDIIENNRFCTVRLTEIFRQNEESLIVTNAHKINKGELPVLTATDKDFFFVSVPEEKIPETVADLICRRLPNAYGKDFTDKIQVITPSRKGRSGTENLNRILQEAINPPRKGKKEIHVGGVLFREGDRVMQMRNDYDLEWNKGKSQGSGVFNGEIGILYKIEDDSVTVSFDGRKTIYDKSVMDELCHSYAITIHKSQGSEYPVVIIPLYACAPVLQTRNLFYTAITRARQMVILVGNRGYVGRMVENDRQVLRYTLLPGLLEQ